MHVSVDIGDPSEIDAEASSNESSSSSLSDSSKDEVATVTWQNGRAIYFRQRVERVLLPTGFSYQMSPLK